MAVPGMQGLDTLYKPWGMTAGGMVGRRETDMEAADLLNLEEGMLGNVLKQVEASRAANDFSDPRMEMLRQQGIMGDNMTKSAQGQMAMGTLNTGIGAKNAKNRADQSGSEIDGMINTMDQSLAMIQANGPAGLAMAVQGLPPQLQQLAQQTGGQFPAVLVKLSDMLKEQRKNDPKHLGKLEETRVGSEETLLREWEMEELKQKGRMALEGQRAATKAAQVKKAATVIEQMVSKGDYKRASIYYDMLSRETDNPLEAQKYRELSAKYEQMEKERMAAAGVKPGAIDVGAASGMPTTQQTPSRQGNTPETKPKVWDPVTKTWK